MEAEWEATDRSSQLETKGGQVAQVLRLRQKEA
jgi:hypothetical protein